MKRTLLFMACVLASLTMSAQENSYFDYVPFVKEGKKWHMVHTEFGTNFHREQYVFRNENVTKTGKTYMTVYRTEGDLTVLYDAGLLREEDRKVYIYDADKQEEHLLFDYSLKEGDSYETYSYDEQKTVTYNVLSVSNYVEGPKVVRYTQEADSMRAEYRYLRKWTVCRADDNTLQKSWIEGVGSLEGPLANLQDEYPISCRDYLAYVEFPDYYRFDNPYLPFSFYDTMNKQIHGCNLPKTSSSIPEPMLSQLTYELKGNRLHIYGKLVSSVSDNYAYFIEEPTDDPLVHKLRFEIQTIGVGQPTTAVGLFTTDFYVPGFDPNLNYIVVDNNGEEHPVINKTPQNEYRPFVEEGKVWQVGAEGSGNPVQIVEYYYFDGDTIIDGKACKQMMCQWYVSPNHPYYGEMSQLPSLSYEGAWYEENKKVYTYDVTNKQFILMYDFSADANDTIQINNCQFVIGPKQTGGIKGFKGVYQDVRRCENGGSSYSPTWMEGVGSIDGPTKNVHYVDEVPTWFLMACAVDDEVIYLNDEYEDGATPENMGAQKRRFDFTHTVKTQPKVPMRREAEQSLYGEYNDKLLGINLDPIDDAYLVRITDETGKVVYEKAIDAGNIVALNVDISSYAIGRYTVTVENSQESFTGEFETQTTGIEEICSKRSEVRDYIYNLQGQRLTSLQKGLNIVNGKKVYVK